MSVAAANILSGPVGAVKDLLAACEAFWGFCGITTGTTEEKIAAAKARVHLFEYGEAARIEDETDDEYRTRRETFRPLAVVGYESGMTAQEDAPMSVYWRHSGSIEVTFEKIIPQAYQADPADALLDLANPVGAILEEIEQNNGRSGFIALDNWTVKEGPAWMEPLDTPKGYLQCAGVKLQIDWKEL